MISENFYTTDSALDYTSADGALTVKRGTFQKYEEFEQINSDLFR